MQANIRIRVVKYTYKGVSLNDWRASTISMIYPQVQHDIFCYQTLNHLCVSTRKQFFNFCLFTRGYYSVNCYILQNTFEGLHLLNTALFLATYCSISSKTEFKIFDQIQLLLKPRWITVGKADQAESSSRTTYTLSNVRYNGILYFSRHLVKGILYQPLIKGCFKHGSERNKNS